MVHMCKLDPVKSLQNFCIGMIHNIATWAYILSIRHFYKPKLERLCGDCALPTVTWYQRLYLLLDFLEIS